MRARARARAGAETHRGPKLNEALAAIERVSDFHGEVDHAVETIRANPEAARKLHREFRRATLRRAVAADAAALAQE